MENKSLAKAKEIFLRYGGSGFHMSREGEYEEYAKYKVSKEQEKEWLKEIIDNKFDKLDIDDEFSIFNFSYSIEHHSYFQYVPKFLDFLESNIDKIANQYYMILYGDYIFSLVENLWRGSRQDKFPRNLRIRCIYLAEEFAKRAKKMELDDNFKIPNYYQDIPQQAYVLQRIYDLDWKIQIAKILE